MKSEQEKPNVDLTSLPLSQDQDPCTFYYAHLHPLPPYSSSCLQHLKEPPTPSWNQSSLFEDFLHLMAHRTF